MSNLASIQQETTTLHKTKHITKSISVFDDYDQGSIGLEDEQSFFEDDMELLLFVLERVKDGGLDSIESVLGYIFEDQKGMFIENTWYDWEQIKPIFEKAGY